MFFRLIIYSLYKIKLVIKIVVRLRITSILRRAIKFRHSFGKSVS